jgi:hypothetical protein
MQNWQKMFQQEKPIAARTPATSTLPFNSKRAPRLVKGFSPY